MFGCVYRLIDRAELWIDRAELWVARRMLAGHLATLQQQARASGCCASTSARQYLCTLEDPHLVHEAVTSDGRVIDRWMDEADMPAE